MMPKLKSNLLKITTSFLFDGCFFNFIFKILLKDLRKRILQLFMPKKSIAANISHACPNVPKENSIKNLNSFFRVVKFYFITKIFD